MINYSFLRESLLIAEYNGRLYSFSALGNISFDTTMSEFKTNRKTVHGKSNYPVTRVTGFNPVSLSLILNFTDNFLETMFFEWLGMERVSDSTLILPFTCGIEPKYLTFYLVFKDGATYKFHNAFVENADFSIERAIPELSVSVKAGRAEQIRSPIGTPSIDQGEVNRISPLVCEVDGQVVPSVMGAGLSFQQQCSWRNNRSVHDTGSMYSETRAVIGEMNFSANISMYKRETPEDYSRRFLDINEASHGSYVKIFNRNIIVDIPNARIAKRLQSDDVMRMGLDIIPMHNSTDPVSITFLREENND